MIIKAYCDHMMSGSEKSPTLSFHHLGRMTSNIHFVVPILGGYWTPFSQARHFCLQEGIPVGSRNEDLSKMEWTINDWLFINHHRDIKVASRGSHIQPGLQGLFWLTSYKEVDEGCTVELLKEGKHDWEVQQWLRRYGMNEFHWTSFVDDENITMLGGSEPVFTGTVFRWFTQEEVDRKVRDSNAVEISVLMDFL